jgi:hypothetical protein
MLKRILRLYVAITMSIRASYLEAVSDWAIERARRDRDEIVAKREASYQAEKAKRDEDKESSSQV